MTAQDLRLLARKREFWTNQIRINLAYADRYEAEGRESQADRRRRNAERFAAKLAAEKAGA